MENKRRKPKKITIYKDAVTIRKNNIKIQLVDGEKGFMINCAFADENANNPAVSHKCLKGKVRISQIHLTEESLQDIILMYKQYKLSKPTN